MTDTIPIFPPGIDPRNWGDIVAPIIVKKLSGKEPTWVKWNKPSQKYRYVTVGSLLNIVRPNDILWGTGSKGKAKSLPRQLKITAVRGPKTREEVIKLGHNCPEVYGDPALLMPYIYKIIPNPKYDLGIIPHHVDYEKAVALANPLIKDNNISIINIKAGVEEVMKAVSRCKAIASSCLHGIILSEALNIPTCFVQFSDKVLGGTYKYDDYYLSTNRPPIKPLNWRNDINIQEALEYSVQIPKKQIDLKPLLKACPFNTHNILDPNSLLVRKLF